MKISGIMECLYAAVILPPLELSNLINEIRKEFAAIHRCFAALKPPVHLTLYKNFIASSDIEKRFHSIKNWTKEQKPFEIHLNDFGFFDNKYKPVVYINVEESKDLMMLHKGITFEINRARNKKNNIIRYKPHVTIGYRDIPKPVFANIIKQYSDVTFMERFVCDSVCIWKHDGFNWRVLRTFVFEGIEDNISGLEQTELF